MDHSLHTAALQNAMPSDSNNQPTTLTRLCQPQYTPDKASAPDFDVALILRFAQNDKLWYNPACSE
jgi:hypothetical protein